jgi:hypothetical protein
VGWSTHWRLLPDQVATNTTTSRSRTPTPRPFTAHRMLGQAMMPSCSPSSISLSLSLSLSLFLSRIDVAFAGTSTDNRPKSIVSLLFFRIPLDLFKLVRGNDTYQIARPPFLNSFLTSSCYDNCPCWFMDNSSVCRLRRYLRGKSLMLMMVL